MTLSATGRPLVITDCDEVLLHMISHFRDWLAEEQGITFDMARHDFVNAMRRDDTGELVPQDEIWALLNRFFDEQMHRQTPVNGAIEAIQRLSEEADVVVLTNLLDHRQESRTKQLLEHGLDLRVFTNQGPKGPALKAILDEYRPSRAVFVDDLPQHHDSVSAIAPEVGRLHLCAEPLIAPNITCAHKSGHAHARIDDWDSALPWLLSWLHDEHIPAQKEQA